jgi:membrane protein
MGPSPLERLKSHRYVRMGRRLAAIVYQELFRTRAFTMAAAMSYYFLLALFPLLIFLSAMLGYLPIPNLFEQLLDVLAVVVPPEAMKMVEHILASLLVPHRGGLLSFGLLSYLWTASGGFVASIEALNVAYDVEDTRGWWRDRLQALLLTLTTGLLLLFGMLLIIAGPHFGHLLTELFAIPRSFGELWPILRLATIFVIFVGAVEVQYCLAPNRKPSFMDTVPGSFVAVIGIFLSSAGLSYYFSHLSNYNKTYGSLGAVIIMMLWLYVVALLFIVGAELNAELLKLKGMRQEAVITSEWPPTVKGAPAA